VQRPHQRLFDRKLGIPIARRSNRSPKDRAKKALCLSPPSVLAMRPAIWPMFASYASSIRTSKWTDSHRIRSREQNVLLSLVLRWPEVKASTQRRD